MHKYVKNIPLIILTLFAFYLQGQTKNAHIKFKNYSIEDGMSTSTGVDILESSNGFIWIATINGVNRFDGYDFKIYKHIHNDNTSLPESYVRAIEEDNDGNIWVGSNAGFLSILNPLSGKVQTLKKFSQINNLGLSVLDITCDKQGNHWVALNEGGIVKITKDKKYTHLTTKTGLPTNFISKIKYKNGHIWAAAGNFILKLSLLGKLEKIYALGDEMMATDLEIIDDKIYFITFENGIKLIDDNVIKDINFGISKDLFLQCNVIQQDNKGYLWIGSNFDGLLKVKPGNKATIYKYNPNNSQSLINNTVYSINFGNSGNMWIGTISGISAIYPFNQQFIHYKKDVLNPKSISDNNIYYIYQDRLNKIWMATLSGGLNLFDPKTEEFEKFTISNSRGLTTNSFRCIYQDKNNDYWIGSGEQGLFKFSPKTKTFKAIKGEKGYEFDEFYVRNIAEDLAGDLWVGTRTGLYNYSQKTNRFLKFQYDSVNLSQNSVYEIKVDSSTGLLMLATFGGGFQIFNPSTQKFVKRYKNNPQNKVSLSNNNVMCVVEYNKDTLLMGTFGGGLNIFDKRTKKFTALTEKDGLSNDAVYGILIDDNNKAWMSTNEGISVYDFNKKIFKNYDAISQVQSLEFNEGAYCKTNNGNFYFGGINGFNVFNPMRIKTNNIAPQIAINQIKVMGKPIALNKILDSQKVVKFSYNQRQISIDFSALQYFNIPKVEYQYKMEGVNNEWIMAGKSRNANFNNLEFGHYKFLVKASNEDGVWSNPVSFSFVIKTPFWNQWWFYFLLGILLLSIILTTFWIRTRSIKRAFQLKMVDAELKALRNQMNPHFIFNSINSIQYYILNKSPKLAYTYLTKFSSLMRQILLNSKQNTISLDQELSSLTLYLELEKLRLDGELNYTIALKNNINSEQILFPSMILQPYVENAILHGLVPKKDNRQLIIEIEKVDDLLQCKIEDNGVGREKARTLRKNRRGKHQSTGMQVSATRLELLNIDNNNEISVKVVDLQDSEMKACGTRIELTIPFKNI